MNRWTDMPRLRVGCGDALELLKECEDESVHCCVTSPPYWGLRDYGVAGQLGLEKTPEEYVAKMVSVFREVRRVLREDGTLWLNIGDSYSGGGSGQNFLDPDGKRPGGGRTTEAGGFGHIKTSRNPADIGLKPKDLCGIPWRLAFALQADGWWLRQDIIWHKPNPMPESVTDRCTKAHEYIFLLTKSARYFYDAEAVKEPLESEPQTRDRNSEGYGVALGDGRDRFSPGARTYGLNGTRNKRSVWTVPSAPYSEAHFATFPPDLIKPCILAGTSARGCCPKCGAPWERVVERVVESPRYSGCPKRNDNGDNRTERSSHTTGWQPTCECEGFRDRSVPATVLDPFGGSGTTGMVALELGRKAIMIELNPSYVKLLMDRTNTTPGLSLA